MSKYLSILFVGVLVGLAACLPASALASEGSEGRYRWTERPDGMTEVWRRDDEGGWVSVGVIPEPIIELASSAADPDLVIARAEKVLYRSWDAGRNWQQLADLPAWPTAMALGQTASGLIYLGTLTGGAFRSEDAGDTWRSLSGDLGLLSGVFLETTALAVHPEDDEIVYAATGYWLGTTEMRFTSNGAFISLDGGQSWQSFNQGDPSEGRITALTPSPHDPLSVQVEIAGATSWHTLESTALLAKGPMAEGPARQVMSYRLASDRNDTDVLDARKRVVPR